MPIYVYKCPVCGFVREVIRLQKIDTRFGEECDCGYSMERQPTAASFNFVGGGWAKDGYSSKE